MKRVLFITKYFSPYIGGGIRRIDAIYRILKNNPDIDLEVVTAVKPDPAKHPGVRHIEQLFFVDSPRGTTPGYNLTKAHLRIIDKGLLGWLPHVLFRILFTHYDIVFASTPVFANVLIGFLYKVARLGKPRLVVEYRDLFSFDPEIADSNAKRTMQKVECIILKRCARVIVTTMGMKNVLSRIISKDKITIVRNYISRTDAETMKLLPKFQFDSNFFHIGYVGTLNTGRNPDRFLSLLNAQYDKKPIMLHFVGTSDAEAQVVATLCRQRGFDPTRVKFHGIVDRMTSLQYMKSFGSVILIINDKAQISKGYGIPGKLYDYSFTNELILCDGATLKNLQTDLDIEECGRLNEYSFFRLNDKIFLDDLINKLFNEIINSGGSFSCTNPSPQ